MEYLFKSSQFPCTDFFVVSYQDRSFLFKKNEADQTRNLRSACLSLRRKEKGKKRLSMSFAMQKKNINELLVTRMEGQNMGDSHLFTCQLDTYFSRLLMTN